MISQKTLVHVAYRCRFSGCRYKRPFSSTAQATMKSSMIHGDTFFLDEFADRQWDDPKFSGTRMTCDKRVFLERVHEEFKTTQNLVDGYAPFCKHVFVPNEFGCTVGALLITEENKHLLETGYTKRRPEELAVLTRWFPAENVTAPVADYLDIILYSREQLIKEHASLYKKPEEEISLPNCPWGIISIKAQKENYETPMNPITMMRNALGKEEGGSGVAIDRDAYAAAVAYWDAHAMIQ